VLNVVTPFCCGPGNARQSLVYLGQIVEALIMRHNALQGPITSISVGLSAMEARHRPGGDGKVVDDRDDDNAPGVLAIRAGAKFGDNQPLDIILGLRKFFHDPHNNRLGLPGKITACRLMWGDRRRNSMADRDRQRRSPRVVLEGASGPVRQIADRAPPLKRPPRSPVRRDAGQLPSLRNQPAHRALATMEKRSLKRALT
jgi:hypothetical protein